MKKKCCAENLKAGKKISELDSFLKVICDPNRLRILRLLGKGERCVCEIFGALKLPQNLVSHHLAKLRGLGLVEERREGTFVFYNLNRKTLRGYKNLFNRIIK